MNTKKPSCFISYCRDGIDRDSINYLIKYFYEISNEEINFIFDEYSLDPGDDLPNFMDLVKTVDGIIVILTPQYKKRVESRIGGVYTEFSKIMERYNKELRAANKKVIQKSSSEKLLIKPPFCLAPLIFSSDIENSCPKELSTKLCDNFSEYRAHRRKNGNLYITPETRRNYKDKIKKIVSMIQAYYSGSTDDFKKSFDEIWDKFFRTTKSEYVQENLYLENVFVKTRSFNLVSSQTSYLLIGRKGSGKSTITSHLAGPNNERYKKHVDINVNDFKLDYAYTFINSPRNKDEQPITINQIETFEITWKLFIYICCIESIVFEYKEDKLSPSQKKHTTELIKFLSEINGENILEENYPYKALYYWCYGKIFEIKDDVISNSRSNLSDFSSDLIKNLSSENIIKKVIGKKVIESLEKILKECNRRFLISLDGFDTAFDEFRMGMRYIPIEKEELLNRVRFELDWLRSFIHVMLEMKSNSNEIPLLSLIDFCAVVPTDRFLEIKKNERDAYVYISKHYDIKWSGIELSIMLRKRLELLGNYKTDPKDRPYDRLKDVLESEFSSLPENITINVSGRDYIVSLFIAVLRHTFWRPREILIYYTKIISVARDFKKRGIEVTNFTISKCISDTTREIISTEFINEFQRHCLNIEDILLSFRGVKQILDINELKNILQKCHFNFIDREESVFEFDQKIDFLYEIGFLGFRANSNLSKRFTLLHNDIFWFMTSNDLFENIKIGNYEGCKFILHPIFCEYLDLDTSNQDLTLNFDWDYLEKQEAYMMI